MDRIETFDDLQFLFERFLGINFSKLNVADFNKSIPMEIRKLYAIRQQFSDLRSNKMLFDKQDMLVPYGKLNFENKLLDFIKENSGNWTLQTELNADIPKVYKDNEEITNSITEFIITYTLQELTFSLEFIDFKEHSLQTIESQFLKIEPLWTNKKYIWNEDSYDYYLVDNDSILMDANGTTFFATNNKNVFDRLS